MFSGWFHPRCVFHFSCVPKKNYKNHPSASGPRPPRRWRGSLWVASKPSRARWGWAAPCRCGSPCERRRPGVRRPQFFGGWKNQFLFVKYFSCNLQIILSRLEGLSMLLLTCGYSLQASTYCFMAQLAKWWQNSICDWESDSGDSLPGFNAAQSDDALLQFGHRQTWQRNGSCSCIKKKHTKSALESGKLRKSHGNFAKKWSNFFLGTTKKKGVSAAFNASWRDASKSVLMPRKRDHPGDWLKGYSCCLLLLPF